MDDEEQRARRQLTDRLVQRFDAPQDDVQQLVDRGFDGFSSARVREFIHLLVEREVADVLRSRRPRLPAQRLAEDSSVLPAHL